MTKNNDIPGAQVAAEKIANAQEPRVSHMAQLLAGERKIVSDYPGLLKKYVAPAVDKMAKLEEETAKLKVADALTKEEQLAADLAIREKQMRKVGGEIIKGMDQVEAILRNQKGSVSKTAKQLGAAVYTKAGKTNAALYAGGLQSVTDIPVKSILKPSPKINDAYRKRVKETQKLITSLKPDGHKRLNKIVNEALKGKETNLRKQVAPLIRKESLRTWETIDNRAQLIAVDQMHTYTADLNEIRNKQAGITHYFWRISGGDIDRVRKQDQKQNGNRYAYADPPPGGNPGKKIRCRCTGEPDLASVDWLQEEQEEKKAPVKPKAKPKPKKKPVPKPKKEKIGEFITREDDGENIRVSKLTKSQSETLEAFAVSSSGDVRPVDAGSTWVKFSEADLEDVVLSVDDRLEEIESNPSGYWPEDNFDDLNDAQLEFARKNEVKKLKGLKKKLALSPEPKPEPVPEKVKVTQTIDYEKSHANWLKETQDDDRKVQAIANWTGGDYEMVRHAQISNYDADKYKTLFASADAPADVAVSFGKDIADNLTRAMKSAPAYTKEVYRGITVKPSLVEALTTPGAQINQQAFSSWSKKRGIAKHFADSGKSGSVPVVFKVKNTEGAVDIQKLSTFKDEAEVLMRDGKKLYVSKVVAKRRYGDDITDGHKFNIKVLKKDIAYEEKQLAKNKAEMFDLRASDPSKASNLEGVFDREQARLQRSLAGMNQQLKKMTKKLADLEKAKSYEVELSETP